MEDDVANLSNRNIEDMTNGSTSDQAIESFYSKETSVFLGVLCITLSLLSTVSNFVLVTVIVKTPLLHTKTNAMIVSVGISEFLVGAFIMPINSTSFFYPLRRFSDSLCYFTEFMTSLTTSSKSLGMLSLSIDRCIAVSHPLQYANCMNKSTTILFITCVWGIGMMFALLPLLGVGNYAHVTLQRSCDMFPHDYVVYPIVFHVTNTIFPATIIVINLTIILMEARSHHRIITIAQLAIAMYSGPAGAHGINYTRSVFGAMRTYLIICVVYLCTCFPKSIYTITVLLDSTTFYNTIHTVLTILFYLCCISTPLVITTMNSKFKQSVKTMFKRVNRVKPLPEAEPYTITTGLQSILETSMVFKYVPHTDGIKSVIGDVRDARFKVRPGPSVEPSVAFVKRRISVLPEVTQSSSSSDVQSGSRHVHIQLRKTLSSPLI